MTGSDESSQKEIPATASKAQIAILLTVAVLSFFATMFAFLPSLGSHFLLDEQFISAWAKAAGKGHALGGLPAFFAWHGPTNQDAYGPVASLACLLMAQWGAGMARFMAIFIHSIASVALYLVSRRLTNGLDQRISILTSVCTAIIFAVHPLSSELISFVGAIGIELSVAFFALSFNFYLAAHPVFNRNTEKHAGAKGILAVIFFALTYMAYAKSWYLIKIFAMFEILNFALDAEARARYRDLLKNKSDPGRRAFFALGMLMLCSLTFMFIEMTRGSDPIGSIIGMVPTGFKNMLLALMFPINRMLWAKYSSQYIAMDVIYVLAALLSVAGIIVSRPYRIALTTALAWTFFGILVAGKDSVIADDFCGHRALAHAQAGISLLIPIMTFGSVSALSSWKKESKALTVWLAAIPSVLICLLLSMFLFGHSQKQTNFYRAAGKLLAKIQKSAIITCAKSGSPYCIVKDLPRRVSLLPVVSPFHPVVLDGKNGLLRARDISGGPLKDALAAGKLRESTVRWDSNFDSLIPVTIEPKINKPQIELNAEKLAGFIHPPIQYWKTVSFDKENGCVSVASNSEHEPGISLVAGELSPLDGDAFYVDAQVKTPVQPSNPNVELNWLTKTTSEFEREDRRSTTLANLNDTDYHRYIIPLRGTGWVMNGPPTLLTIGFPSSSTVKIKGIGIVGGKNIFPTIHVGSNIEATGKHDHYCDFCFNYPYDQALGLCHIDKVNPQISIDYDISAIAGGASASLFSTAPDQFALVSDTGELPDLLTFKETANGPTGNFRIGLDKFPTSGIYPLKIAAIGSTGRPVGKFSDTIWLLVDKNK